MLKLGAEKESLQVVDDQHGLPTYTLDLATSINTIIQNILQYRGQTCHLTNSGEHSISWYEFTQEICKQADLKCDIQPCESSVYPRPAPRPSWSELKNDSDIQLPEWKDGLGRYLEKR